MSNFMGPMAPPQAAPSQPPQLDIRTNPNQRERFRDFMRQNTRPSMGMALPMAQPMAPAPMPMASMPPAPNPPIPMAIRPTPPMMPQPMASVDVFSPQYMNQPRPMRLEDGGSVPPRNVDIKGQPHMLSYITPDEADILEALGGSGEPGPMGIPAFDGHVGGADPDSGPGAAAGFGGGGGGGGADDRDGPDPDRVRSEDLDAAQATKDRQRDRDEADRQERQARQAREARQQRRDQISRMQDRVQAGLAREDLVTSPGVTTPEARVTATRSPGLIESTIAAVGDTDDDTDAGGIETTDLLGVDDLLSIDPRNERKFSTVAGQTAVSPVTGPPSGTTTAATVNDPMAVARGISQIRPKGIMDIGLINAAADFIGGLFGLSQDPEAVRSDYANRGYSSLGMSPATASAVLGTQSATYGPNASVGPVTGAIGGPRGGIMGGLFGGYSPGAAGMTGMAPDGTSTGAITGDQLADLATRNRSGLLGPITGLFNDLTLSAASKSKVAVVNPATGKIVGAIDGRGRYTGSPEFNPNTYGQPQGPQGDGPVLIPPVVQPPTVTDPGPDEPNVFGGTGDTTPYQPLVQNFTDDGRERFAGTLRMPVGFGDPRTGFIAPQAFSTAGFLPPAGPIPIGFFEDGGEVLNQAADNFLEALTAA